MGGRAGWVVLVLGRVAGLAGALLLHGLSTASTLGCLVALEIAADGGPAARPSSRTRKHLLARPSTQTPTCPPLPHNSLTATAGKLDVESKGEISSEDLGSDVEAGAGQQSSAPSTPTAPTAPQTELTSQSPVEAPQAEAVKV